RRWCRCSGAGTGGCRPGPRVCFASRHRRPAGSPSRRPPPRAEHMAAVAGGARDRAARMMRAAQRLPYPRRLMDAVARWVRDLPPTRADALLAVVLAILAAALTPLV